MIYTAEDVVQARKKLGLTQEELADKLQISRQWLIKIEKGKQDIGPHQVALLDKLILDSGGKLDLHKASEILNKKRPMQHYLELKQGIGTLFGAIENPTEELSEEFDKAMANLEAIKPHIPAYNFDKAAETINKLKK